MLFLKNAHSGTTSLYLFITLRAVEMNALIQINLQNNTIAFVDWTTPSNTSALWMASLNP